MPHVIVKLWPGKTEQQKQQLAEQIAESVIKVLHYGSDAVSVGFEQISAEDWAKAVYEPDIEGKWDTLYKKPGYRM